MPAIEALQRLRYAIVALATILVAGTLGYRFIEGLSFLDSLYMTLITITTVGFKEVSPLSPAGKIFTMVIILGGVGTVFYALIAAMEFMVEGHFFGLIGRRAMERRIAELQNHYIICGYGRVGQQIAKELKSAEAPLVVIDHNAEALEECKSDGHLYIEGNAAEDEVLKRARIGMARGLVAASDSDPDNVFITLAARGLSPSLLIVARASVESSFEKLRKAGADRVISPYLIAGRRMSSLLLRPLVTDYLDIVTHAENLEFRLEEVEVKANSSVAGRSIKDSSLRDKAGVLVLAVKKGEGEMVANPPVDTVIGAGDSLVVMGTADQLRALEEIL
jgi:voltage-gated potassium channel